jgi:hypothetical protein
MKQEKLYQTYPSLHLPKCKKAQLGLFFVNTPIGNIIKDGKAKLLKLKRSIEGMVEKILSDGL